MRVRGEFEMSWESVIFNQLKIEKFKIGLATNIAL